MVDLQTVLHSYLVEQSTKYGPRTAIKKILDELALACESMEFAPEDYFRLDPFNNTNPIWQATADKVRGI